jgi:hypothetical protein
MAPQSARVPTLADLMANPGVAARIHPADQGDTQTLAATLEQADAMLNLVSLVLMPDTPAERAIAEFG